MRYELFILGEEKEYFDVISAFLNTNALGDVDEAAFQESLRLVMRGHDDENEIDRNRLRDSRSELVDLMKCQGLGQDEKDTLSKKYIFKSKCSTFNVATGYEIQHALVYTIQEGWRSDPTSRTESSVQSLRLLYAFCRSQLMPHDPAPIMELQKLKELARDKCGDLAGNRVADKTIAFVVELIALFDKNDHFEGENSVKKAFAGQLKLINRNLVGNDDQFLPCKDYTDAACVDQMNKEKRKLIQDLLDSLGDGLRAMYGGSLTVTVQGPVVLAVEGDSRPESEYVDKLCVNILLHKGSPPGSSWEKQKELCLKICRLSWMLYNVHQHVDVNVPQRRTRWCNHYQMAFSMVALLCCLEEQAAASHRRQMHHPSDTIGN